MFKILFVVLVTCLVVCDHCLVQASDDQIVNNEDEPQRLSKGTPSTRKCALLKNAYMSDVNLIAVDRNGDEEFIEAIPAHKLILGYSSPVFERMIWNSDSFSAVIRIEHISLRTLDALLK